VNFSPDAIQRQLSDIPLPAIFPEEDREGTLKFDDIRYCSQICYVGDKIILIAHAPHLGQGMPKHVEVLS
jgi:hypothetical protein